MSVIVKRCGESSADESMKVDTKQATTMLEVITSVPYSRKR